MSHALSGERLLALYREMLLVRRFEEQAGLMYQMKKFSGFCHLYIGQEAVGSGCLAALRDDDYVIGTYREHGQALARGMSARSVMAELYAKRTGCTGGIGGSMHLYDVERRFMGGWGIVGAHVPIAAGLAFACKYQKTDSVCMCFLGEGSIHQGAFHEAMNMAAMWQLPLVVIVENNLYAMGTPIERQTNVHDVHRKAEAYDVPNEACDGQDLRKVYDQTLRAVERARRGEGPTLIEMKTYRFRGHSMSDPAKYRSKEEVDKEMGRDPLHTARRWLVDEGTATDEELDALDREVKAEVKDAIQFAEESEPPPLEALYENVYVAPLESARSQQGGGRG